MGKTAFAIGCHPDDIEIVMAGTMLKLKAAGYELHYMNVANGSLGTNKYEYRTIVPMRRKEAMASAKMMGAVFHESLCDDLEVFYSKELLERLVPIVREVEPDIILTHAPYEYMEDHVNAGRLAVSAAFCRGMVNFKCKPKRKAIDRPVTVYHCLSHTLTDQLRRPVVPGIFVDITDVVSMKRKLLACHKSQKDWLDASQGNDSYLDSMEAGCRVVGRMSGRYKFAEGWIRHSHVGFCPETADPLVESLGKDAFVNMEFERSLKWK